MRLVLSLVILVAHVTSDASAASWERVIGQTNVDVYVDTESIENRGSARTATVITDGHASSTTMLNGRQVTFLSTKASAYFDCSRQAASFEEAIYNGPFASGNSIGTRSSPPMQAVRHTVGGDLLHFVCGWQPAAAEGSARKDGCYHLPGTYHSSPTGGWYEEGPLNCPPDVGKLLEGLGVK